MGQRVMIGEGVVRGMIREELVAGMSRRMGVVLLREWQVLRDLFGWDREQSQQYVEAHEFTEWLLGTAGLVAMVAATVVTGPALAVVGGVAVVAKVGEIALKATKVTEDEAGEFHWDPDWFGLAGELVGSKYFNPEKIGKVVGHVSKVGRKATTVACEMARTFFEEKEKLDELLDRPGGLRSAVEGVEKYMMGQGNEGKYSQYLKVSGTRIKEFYDGQIKGLQTYLNHQIGGEGEELVSQRQVAQGKVQGKVKVQSSGLEDQETRFKRVVQGLIAEKEALLNKGLASRRNQLNYSRDDGSSGAMGGVSNYDEENMDLDYDTELEGYIYDLEREIRILKSCLDKSDPKSVNQILSQQDKLKKELEGRLKSSKNESGQSASVKSEVKARCVKISKAILKKLKEAEPGLQKLNEACEAQGVKLGIDSVLKVTRQIQESDIAGAVTLSPARDVYDVIEVSINLPKPDPQKVAQIGEERTEQQTGEQKSEEAGKETGAAALFTIPNLPNGYKDLAKVLNQKFGDQFGKTLETQFLRKLYQDRFLIVGDRIDLRDIVQGLAGQQPDMKIYSAKTSEDNQTNVFKKRPDVQTAMARIKAKK